MAPTPERRLEASYRVLHRKMQDASFCLFTFVVFKRTMWKISRSGMEQTGNRISWLSVLTDARQELRSHLVLETALMEHAAALPPETHDDHNSQETFQFGAGWAYIQRHTPDLGPEDIYDAFFAIKLKRWNLPEEYLSWERQHVIAVAQLMLVGEDLELYQLDMRIEVPIAQDLVAFIEGFVITRDYFADLGYTPSMPSAVPA